MIARLYPTHLTGRFQRNKTPLLLACEQRRAVTAELLIAKEADLEAKDKVR